MIASPEHTLAHAADSLASVLEEENQALQALDFAAAVSLLGAKQRAAARFVEAERQTRSLAPAARTGMGARCRRLHGLVADNRRLLERALLAQGRVIAVIARAARNSPEAVPHYGARGTPVAPSRPFALAFSTRI
jgi:hypothetical protein